MKSLDPKDTHQLMLPGNGYLFIMICLDYLGLQSTQFYITYSHIMGTSGKICHVMPRILGVDEDGGDDDNKKEQKYGMLATT